MTYILALVIVLLIFSYLVAKLYVSFSKNDTAYWYIISEAYIEVFWDLRVGIIVLIVLIILSIMEPVVAYWDFVRLNELYVKIESAKAETKGYVYEYCHTNKCACYYYRIAVNGKEYTGCARLKYPLHVGDSIDVYYYKLNPKSNDYKPQHKKVVGSYWLYLDDLNWGLMQALFYKKEESKDKYN